MINDNMGWTYFFIAAVLLALEVCYFKVADRLNIIDKPNERSSHSTIVLRGGGVIFAISMLVWFGWQITVQNVQGVQEFKALEYLPFLCGLVLIAGVSLWDDVRSLPDSVRLVAQFAATVLMVLSLGGQEAEWFNGWAWYWQVLAFVAWLTVCVGATNIINFMDGINGITAGYSLAVLVPLALLNGSEGSSGFVEESFLVVAIIGVLVFSIFNFWPKGKAKCFAGDVGSVGIAFIMLFAIGRLICHTQDVTYLILLLVYGVDGCMTIAHRIMLHEHLGEAHRKHAYQLMANELKIGHVKVSLLYAAMQLAVSLGFIYVCPNDVTAHWIYLMASALVLGVAYILFMKKYYHLHEEYLKGTRIGGQSPK